jgi:hypothetical protein
MYIYDNITLTSGSERDIIERKRLQWYGHVKRMQKERIPKLIMEWIPGREEKEDVQKKRGRKEYEQPWKQDN